MAESLPSGDGRPLRAGVIGVGYLGRFHAQKYARIAGVSLVGVADMVPERAARVAAELGVPAVSDFRALLERVDLVSVVTPTHAHHAVAGACLSAGVHVLVEKPMTVTLEEADDLIGLADRMGRWLQVGHIKRFHPAVAVLDAGGHVVRPRFLQAERFAPFKNRALDVDVVLDLMIHDVDLVLHFAGSEVADVEAVGASVLSGQTDLAYARIRFDNGCLATVAASRVAREATRRLRIYQPDAMIELDFIRQELVIARRGRGERQLEGVTVPLIEELRPEVPRYDTLEAEIRSFCEAVRSGRPPVVDGRAGRRALEVVWAIRRAIGAGGS